MQTIKSIDVWYLAKATGLISLAIGLIYGAIFAFISGWIAFIFPIIIFVSGFLGGALFAWLYNLLERHIGGIRWDYGNNVLKSLDVYSVAKIDTFLAMIFAFIFGVVVAVIAGFAGGLIGAIVGVVLVIVLVIVGAISGFVSGAIVSFLYNVFAGWVGGYRFEIHASTIKNVNVLSVIKIAFLISVIFILFDGFILFLSYSANPSAITSPPTGSAASLNAAVSFVRHFGIGGGIAIFIAFYLAISIFIVFIQVILYNAIAKRNLGGVKLSISK